MGKNESVARRSRRPCGPPQGEVGAVSRAILKPRQAPGLSKDHIAGSYGAHLFGSPVSDHLSRSYLPSASSGGSIMDGPGRPSLYKPEFAAQAFDLCLAGATNRDLADCFDVGHSTIDNWLQRHPEFSQSLKRGRSLADGRFAHGLYSPSIS